MNTINPYDVFGLTINSSLDDVRKAYYQLALLCHPDKGGSPDDMRLVHACYLWLKEQIAHKGDQTYEDACEMFAAFWRDRAAATFDVKAMDEIYWETMRIDWAQWLDAVEDQRMHWLIKNSVYRELCQLPPTFSEDPLQLEGLVRDVIEREMRGARSHGLLVGNQIQGGYGAFLDASTTSREDEPAAPTQDFGQQQMVTYREPLSENEACFQYVPADHCLPQELDDYSMKRQGCDYKLAMSHPCERGAAEPDLHINAAPKTYQDILADMGQQ